MAANHTALRVQPQDLYENHLRDSDTRSVRRASGLVLVGDPEITVKPNAALQGKIEDFDIPTNLGPIWVQ